MPNLAEALRLLEGLREQGALETRFLGLADTLAQMFDRPAER